MPRLTPEQVLALAPDAAAAATAREMASASKWRSEGTDEVAIWGEALGSGKNPYQTAVDLGELAYKCSCPSRKIPCKHALGLLLRHAQSEVGLSPQPTWVEEWLEQRSARATRQVERASGATPDPEAAEKRVEKRWNNILAGLEECQAFLSDIAGQGLLTAQSSRSWDQMAARMVDAQAPGVAARLRLIGARIGVGDRWGKAAAGQLGSIALLIQGAKRVETLAPGLQSDVRTALGIPIRTENLPDEAVADVWDVVGQILEVEDRLTICRSWLKGRESGKWAMHLAFSAAGQPFGFRPIPGSALVAEVQFFPSSWPMRVHLKTADLVPFQPTLGESWQEALARSCEVWALSPWVDQVPVHLKGAHISRNDKTWFAVDANGEAIALRSFDPWHLLACSGNHASDIHGEWDGLAFRILASWGDWGYLAL